MKRSIIILAVLLSICLPLEARQPQRGYRGFFEWSNDLRSDYYASLPVGGVQFMYRQTNFFTGISTSHGYQINDKFFIGAGLGIEHCPNIDNYIVPVFVQGRIDLKFGKFTPFGDLRAGVNAAEGVGMYLSPAIGYRFNWGRKSGINLGIGLSLAGYRAEHYEASWVGPDSYEIYYIGTKHHVRPYFTFRLGIDF